MVPNLQFICLLFKMEKQLHATCISVNNRGILIKGPSGSGKSDLALRLINDGGHLIADDRVIIKQQNTLLLASPPNSLSGLIEVRGIGIVKLHFQKSCAISLVISLVTPEKLSRLPKKQHIKIFGIKLPMIHLAAFETSTVTKVHLALSIENGDIIRQDD